MNTGERTTPAMADVLSIHDKLNFMLDFTRAHARHADDICAREIECLRIQHAAQMLPPREGDILVGRCSEPLIGFSPEPLGSSGVGYFCHDDKLKALRTDAALSDAQRTAIDELIAYWAGRTTKARIFARYDGDMREKLTHGPLDSAPGVAYPLYRLGGGQPDPRLLLKLGIEGMIEHIEPSAAANPSLFSALKAALVEMSDVCARYAALLTAQAEAAAPDRAAHLSIMADDLTWLRTHPPKRFRQAMQLAHLYYLMADTINYGRMDDYLGDYLQHDLDAGEVSEAEAYALVRNLWTLLIERGPIWDVRIAVGGRGRQNEPAADRFALLALRASRELRDTLPQLTLRCYDGMNPALYERAMEMIGDGVTYPILYNDDVNIPAVMCAFGVEEKTAERYLPFGCGEYILYGQSLGTPSGAINLLYALNEVIEAGALQSCADFDSFYQRYKDHLGAYIMLMARQEKIEYDVCAEDAPFLYFTLLYDDCIARAKPVLGGGVRHLGGTLESYGNTNSADSLTAIKRLVYDERRVDPGALTSALRDDFAGQPLLRKRLLDAPKYGNDDPDADEMAVRLHNDLCAMIRDSAAPVGLDSYLNVTINNSMNTTFGLITGASADGRAANTFLANANNPTGGMDNSGITAMLNSLVKLKVDHHAGSVQNMRFSKEMFGRLMPQMNAILRTYFRNGGSQAMITVLGRGELEDAMQHPEAYKNLLVRVGGFSARFVELDKNVQLELLSRTLY